MRTAYTSEEQPTLLDNNHWEIIDDRLNIAEFTQSETEALYAVSCHQNLGYSNGIDLASALSAESPISQPSYDCKQLINAVNRLPRNSKLLRVFSGVHEQQKWPLSNAPCENCS